MYFLLTELQGKSQVYNSFQTFIDKSFTGKKSNVSWSNIKLADVLFTLHATTHLMYNTFLNKEYNIYWPIPIRQHIRFSVTLYAITCSSLLAIQTNRNYNEIYLPSTVYLGFNTSSKAASFNL